MSKIVYIGSCKIVSYDEMKEPTLEFRVTKPMDSFSNVSDAFKKKVDEVMADETRCHTHHVEITVTECEEAENAKLYPKTSYTKYYYEW